MEFDSGNPRKKKRNTEMPKEGNCSRVPSSDSTKMVDRISNLPDELLCHILSLLPTKLAFTTTLLSKRWTRLCYSLPILQFDHEIDEAFDRFCSFVDTFMLYPHATNQPLKTFRLKCYFGKQKRDRHIFNKCFVSWLEAAKRRHVEEFDLTLNFHTLNPIIFVSQTLVALKLDMFHFASDTSRVRLPSLKTLYLKNAYFKNRNYYINFLSACPILEDLHAEHIFIRSEMKHYKNNVPKEGFKFLTLPKLVRASISSMDALFSGIDNVEFLRVITGFKDQEASFKFIPLFSNLIQIELVFCNGSFHCWYGVVELLRHCPKLQILFIKKWTKTSSSEEWKCPISVPECVSSHLRSCKILNLHDTDNDLRFATYILQNASVLQDMKTGFSTNGMLLKKRQIREELSRSMISPQCKLSFQFKYCY